MCIFIYISTRITFILKSSPPHGPPRKRKKTRPDAHGPPRKEKKHGQTPLNEILSFTKSIVRYSLKPGYRT